MENNKKKEEKTPNNANFPVLRNEKPNFYLLNQTKDNQKPSEYEENEVKMQGPLQRIRTSM